MCKTYYIPENSFFLGDLQSHFIPSMIAPFLATTLVAEPGWYIVGLLYVSIVTHTCRCTISLQP